MEDKFEDAIPVTLTVSEVRDGSRDDIMDKLDEALDLAQGSVFSGEQAEAYVLITIKKG